MEGRSKTISICRCYNLVYRKPKESTKTLLELISDIVGKTSIYKLYVYIKLYFYTVTMINPKNKIKKIIPGDFPGVVVVKTPCSQCRGPGFDPWSGN